MTPALIRCAGHTPEKTIDIMVQSDGAITSLGLMISELCRDILWGHHASLWLMSGNDPENRIRLGREENLGSLVFGLLWPKFDNVETSEYDIGTVQRRYSHNQFVIGPKDDANLARAYYVYHVEFRDYPEPYLGSTNSKRVWINITNDRLETIFEGWPEAVFSMAQAKADEEEQEALRQQGAVDA